MDQAKIGKFIGELRKEKKLKQAEVLARMLNDTAYVEFLSEHRKRLY